MDDPATWTPSARTSIVLTLAILAVTFALLQRHLSPQTDPREPPVLHPSIPLIGHIINFLRKGADHLVDLDTRSHKPLYTLLFGSTRLYVVASPEWAQAIHKSHRHLHFNTLVAQAMEHLFCMDKPTMDVLNRNLNGEDGTRQGLMIEMHDLMGGILAPGGDLDAMNESILRAILPDVNGLARSGAQRIQLWEWLRGHFSLASTSAIWGARNAFAMYPDVEPAFWEFEAHMLGLMITPMPSIFARKAWRARERLFDTFEEYMVNKWWEQEGTCQLIRKRVELNMMKYGSTPKMHARADVSFLFGALLNTIPSAFWLVSYIFEDLQLLSDIRTEIDACVTTSDGKANINVPALRSMCPLLHSAFREVLRITGSVNINRIVASDITLTNASTGESYLLKKDSTVHIASNVIHQSPLWGSDTNTFNPRRFLSSSGEKTSITTMSSRPPDPAAPFRDGQGKVYSGAFRSFGGGNNICPGRFFAQTEILGLVALFVGGFEIEGAEGESRYRTPPTEAFNLSLGVLKPGRDVEVLVRRRQGYEGMEWRFEM